MDSQTFAAETYHDCKPVLDKLASRFYSQRRHMLQKIGKDIEDVQSLSNELFWKAYTGHDESLGPFQSRLTYVVWNGLLDRFQTDYTTIKLRTSLKDTDGEPLPLDFLPGASRSRFTVRGLRTAIGGDAKRAVTLALYPPASITKRAEKAGGSARNYRAAIRAYLIDELGFTTEEVLKCFAEIAEQLEDFDPDSHLD